MKTMIGRLSLMSVVAKRISRTCAVLAAVGLGLWAGSSRADTTINNGDTFTIDDGNTTKVGGTTTWNDTGTLTIYNDATLQTWPSQNDVVPNNDAIVFTGAGGTITLRFNDNDTKFTMSGPVTSSASGAQTLAITLGNNGNGDRESVVFNTGIPDANGHPLSLTARFTTQSGSESYLSLPGVNTFTGPITLTKGDNVQNAYLTIGGVKTKNGNTPGSGKLGNGNYPGDISLDTTTHLYYDSSADQILSGTISGNGDLIKDGSGTLTISGTNSCHGNTTVSSGTLVLDPAGSYTFYVTDTGNNKITGTGTATLNGTFIIDTSAFTGAIGSWTLVDTTTKSFGDTFGVTDGVTSWGAPVGTVFTKVDGLRTWTFDTSTGVLHLSAPALITSFSYLTYNGIIDQNALTIHLAVPQGTDVTTLAPIYAVSSGNGSPVSGTVRDFSSTKTYTITDGAIHNTYTVTVSIFTGLNEKTYLNRANFSDLEPISNLLAATPDATGHQVDNIDYHFDYGVNFNVLPGNPGPENFSILWEGWFDVLAAGGYGTYTFGTSSDDGSVIYMDLNGNGSFADAGEYIVNNNYYRADTAVTGEVTLNMDSVHMVIGYYQSGGGADMRAAWKKGTGYGFSDLALINGTAGYFFPTDPHPPIAQILSFTISGHAGVINQGAKTIHVSLPHGSSVTSLAPTYTVSSGVGTPATGTTHDFTSPVIYTVTDVANATTNHYTATVIVLPPGPPVTDYARWFDASTLGLADNAPVTQWNDNSVNAANATVPGGMVAPVYVANSGMESGLGAVHFDVSSGDSVLQFAEDSNIRTIFAVFKGRSFLITDATTGAYDFHRWYGVDDDPTVPLLDGPDANSWSSGNLWTANGAQNYVNGVSVDCTTFQMPNVLHNGFNLVELLSTDKVTADSWNYDRGNCCGHYGDQFQAEVIIYDRLLFEEERLQVETYLSNKWFTVSAPPPTPPTASFTATPASGFAPLQVVFTNTSSAGGSATIAGCHWDFGDSQTANTVGLSNVTNTYTSVSDYAVTLTVTNSDSLTDSIAHTIHVADVPTPEFKQTGTVGVDPATGHATISFTGTNGVKYRIVYKDDLLDTGAWKELNAGVWSNGVNGANSLRDDSTSGVTTQRFYKLEAVSVDGP